MTALVALVAFREGLICLAMLALPWLGTGMLGVRLFYRLRRRVEGVRLDASVMLLLPLLLIQAEAAIPPMWQQRTVTRSIEIDVPPERVWPLLLALPRIGAGEGRWNVSQNLLRVPRPLSAVVRAGTTGPVRIARWQDGIVFAEALTRVEPGRALEWRFLFPDPTLHHHVDRHIDPRGPLLDIESGGYRLEPLPGARSRLTLTTRYRLRTWAAPYAALWGELVLGDVQDNILAIVAGRAA